MLFDFIKRLLGKENPKNIGGGLYFPNAITKEEYYRRKKDTESKALLDTPFWDKLEVGILAKNIEYCKRGVCPYCGKDLPKKKGKTYKCPECKQKVHKRREILTEQEGLFTDEESENLNALWEEFQARKTFLKLFFKAKELIDVDFGNEKTDINTAINHIIVLLRLGKPQYYVNLYKNRKEFKKLRDCRFLEGEFQRRYGTIQESTNIYMQILYLDIIEDFDMCFFDTCSEELSILTDFDDNDEFILTDSEKKKLTKKTFKHFNQKDIFLAPAIYDCAFQEDLPIEKLEKIFKFNANELYETIKPKPQITPVQAWLKILQYRANLKKTNN